MYFVDHIKRGTLAQDSHERMLDKLRNRTTPVFVIILFSAVVSVLRYYLFPQFGVLVHTGFFLLQVTVLTCIWFVVGWLNSQLERRMPFEKGPVKRIAVQIFCTFLLVTPVILAISLVTAPYFPKFITPVFIGLGIAVFVLMIFLFNFAYYAFYFFSNWQNSIVEKAQLKIQAADLEREKFNLQYHQLKNQVNPHYLFNSLTSLDGLIQTNPELASEFVKHMSKVYRYVLQHKENEVVNLDEELEFIEHYIQLLHIRYDGGLTIHHNISAAARERGIVMVTLQLLIDNAVKHNIVQASNPLKVIIWDEDQYLVVYNNKQLRKQIETSNNHGLAQLKQLYSYLSEKPLVVDDNQEHFTIKIPLL